MPASIDDLIDDARTRLRRVDPFETAEAMAHGALVHRAWRAAGLPITFDLAVPRDETEAPTQISAPH